jgi:hypothetical protein
MIRLIPYYSLSSVFGIGWILTVEAGLLINKIINHIDAAQVYLSYGIDRLNNVLTAHIVMNGPYKTTKIAIAHLPTIFIENILSQIYCDVKH